MGEPMTNPITLTISRADLEAALGDLPECDTCNQVATHRAPKWPFGRKCDEHVNRFDNEAGIAPFVRAALEALR